MTFSCSALGFKRSLATDGLPERGTEGPMGDKRSWLTLPASQATSCGPSTHLCTARHGLLATDQALQPSSHIRRPPRPTGPGARLSRPAHVGHQAVWFAADLITTLRQAAILGTQLFLNAVFSFEGHGHYSKQVFGLFFS